MINLFLSDVFCFQFFIHFSDRGDTYERIFTHVTNISAFYSPLRKTGTATICPLKFRGEHFSSRTFIPVQKESAKFHFPRARIPVENPF